MPVPVTPLLGAAPPRCCAPCSQAPHARSQHTPPPIACPRPWPPRPAVAQLLNVTEFPNVFQLYADTKEYICCGLKDTAWNM